VTDTTASLNRKITSATDLQSVVRTMKTLAASSVGQYEESVRALADYYRAVELALAVCFHELKGANPSIGDHRSTDTGAIGAIVFGSDQGLVGRFNEVIADFAIETLAAFHGQPQVWAVGERVHARLVDAGLPVRGVFTVPSTVKAIAPLVGQIQIAIEAHGGKGETASVYVFHNRPHAAALHEPISARLLPLDAQWQQRLANIPWPTGNLPEVISGGIETVRALIREYLFISLFQACAESLASENASRLAAMERADRNIEELLEYLLTTYHRLRQESIDAELFDLISGYEALESRGADRD
jgi:F-type H+-transporting ATPase subunit gamma